MKSNIKEKLSNMPMDLQFIEVNNKLGHHWFITENNIHVGNISFSCEGTYKIFLKLVNTPYLYNYFGDRKISEYKIWDYIVIDEFDSLDQAKIFVEKNKLSIWDVTYHENQR